jgi:DNA polymerase-1
MPTLKTDDIIYPGTNGLVLVVDGNNAMARAGHAFSQLTGPDGRPSGALFGALKEVKRMLLMGKFKSIIFVKDAGRPAFRVEAVNRHAEDGDGYKAHRKEKRDAKAEKIHEDYLSQLDYCHKLMNTFGVHVVSARNWEADDVIGSLVYRYPEEKFTILSGDHDLWQLCLKGARVYNPNKLEFVDRPADNYVLCRAVSGDKSDNIPGIRGVGEGTFNKLVEQCGLEGINVPKKFCRILERKARTLKKVPAAVTKIIAGKEALADYFKAMHLKNAKEAIDTIEIYEGIWDEKSAKKQCTKLGFKSLTMEWQSFSKAFADVAARIGQ